MLRYWSGAGARGGRPFVRSVFVAVAIACALGGCCVLTRSQVEAVSDFAAATKDFPDQPATVMVAHAKLRSERGLLLASTLSNPTPALTALERGVGQDEQLRALADSASAALAILEDYTALLGTLSSDQFTKALQNSAVKLGASIDQGVAAFNKAQTNSANQIDPFGDAVAAVVRGGGGIIIRQMQYKALKDAVITADPAVAKMTDAVRALMSAYVAQSGTEPTMDLFGAEFQQIRDAFPRMRSSGGHWDLATLDRVEAALRQSHLGAQLAKDSMRAAGSYRAAHTALRAALERDTDVSALKEQIGTLAAEVRAGKTARDEAKKARKS